MSNPINTILNQQVASTKNVSATPQTKKEASVGNASTINQNDFLNLLVTQLQNQDPLNPMENEQFAVQLATFSQLEQLIQINGKMDGGQQGGMNIGSMASYLGHEVALPDGKVEVSNGSGSNLFATIPAGTESVRVDLRNEEGRVVGSTMIEPLPGTGPQVLSLQGLDVPDGKYDFRVLSVSSDGRFVDLPAKPTGTVEGFVMEPEPRLLVGGQEFSLNEVNAVFNGVKK
jgi:flagellar basal-body rod modification protein FlgD